MLRAADAKVEGFAGGLSPRRRSALLLGISLFFAGAMIATSWLLEGEGSQKAVFLLIALWWIPFSVLTAGVEGRRKARCGEGD